MKLLRMFDPIINKIVLVLMSLVAVYGGVLVVTMVHERQQLLNDRCAWELRAIRLQRGVLLDKYVWRGMNACQQLAILKQDLGLER